MHQTRLIAALLQNLLDTVFFAKILLAAARKLDLHSVCLCQHLGVPSKVFTQRLCKSGIIKDANPLLIQIMRHSLRVTEWLQTAGDHDAIITTQNSIQFIGIPFRKQFVHGSTPIFAGGLSNLTTVCYNMHEGKSPLGYASRLSRFSRLWRATPCATFPFWFRLVRVRYRTLLNINQL